MKTAILEAPLHRMIEVAGIEGAIVLTISPSGLSFRLKHSQKEVAATWDKVIAMCEITHPHVPTYLLNEPFTFLQVVGQQMLKRKESRLIEQPNQMMRIADYDGSVRLYKAFNPAFFPAFNPALTDFHAKNWVKIIKEVVNSQSFRG
jgi:hypothetical protein